MTGVCPALIKAYHSISFVILAYLGIYQHEAVPTFLCLFNLLEQSPPIFMKHTQSIFTRLKISGVSTLLPINSVISLLRAMSVKFEKW